MSADLPLRPVSPRWATLDDALRWYEAHRGDQLAYRFLEHGETAETTTFAELADEVRRVASVLSGRVQPGDRALLVFPPGLAFVRAFLACLASGTVAVPVSPPDPNHMERQVSRLSGIAADSGATVGVTVSSLLPVVRAAVAGDPVLRRLDWLACDGALDVSQRTWTPGANAFLQYSSGSTGQPKGIALSHKALVANLEATRRAFRFGRVYGQDVVVSWLPPFHDMGLIGMILQPLWSGEQAVLMSPIDFLRRPVSWLEAIDRYGGTISGGPDFAYALTARRLISGPPKLDLSRWRLAFNGAEPVRAATLRSFIDAASPFRFAPQALFPCYGLAESTLYVSGAHLNSTSVLSVDRDALQQGRMVPATDGPSHELVSCGTPGYETALRVVDPLSLAPVPEGTVGELHIQSTSLADGYFEDPTRTEATFLGDTPGSGRWLRTGDLGAVLNGHVFVSGRIKDRIVRHGVSLAPEDVEDAIARADARVRPGSVAVFNVDPVLDERVIALVELRVDTVADLHELRTAIVRNVAATTGVALDDVTFLRRGQLPKTTSGKLRRAEARLRYQTGRLTLISGQPDTEPPARHHVSDHFVRVAMAALEQALGRPVGPADVHQPLATLGLDSTSVVELASVLSDTLDRDVSPAELFDARSLASLETPDRQATIPAQSPPNTGGRVAVLGYALRTPGARSAHALWVASMAGARAVATDGLTARDTLPTPDSAIALGIRAAEAQEFGPLQLRALTIAWQAGEHAGLPLERLRGERVGVFVGASPPRRGANEGGESAFAIGGKMFASIAGRLAHLYDFRGPALVVDTACSASLVACHQARQALAAGDCDFALVVGVQVVSDEATSVALREAGVLSPSGRSRPFTTDADGYVRADGAVAVLLAHEHSLPPISSPRAWLRATAIGHDGASATYTGPRPGAQTTVLQQAWVAAGVSTDTLAYIETHGTGTALGDPIEIAALKKALDGAHERIPFAATKATVAHTEAAAGLLSLVRAVMAVEQRVVPPLPGAEHLAPEVERAMTPSLRAARQPEPFRGNADCVGVSSFGLSGTNVHAVVSMWRPVQPSPSTETVEAPNDSWQLVGTSGFTAHEATRLARLAAGSRHAQPAHPSVASELAWRAVSAGTTDAERRKGLLSARATPCLPRPLHIVCGGQGSAHAGMGIGWLQEPRFVRALESLEQSWHGQLAVPARHLLDGTDPLADPVRQQQAIVALQVAQIAFLRSLGVPIAKFAGFSLGECTAAWAGGALSLSDLGRLVTGRAHAMRTYPSGGGMMFAGCSSATLHSCNALCEGVVIAIRLHEDACVLAGDADALELSRTRLGASGVNTSPVRVPMAFHHPRLAQAAEAAKQAIASMSPPRATPLWVSSLEVVEGNPGDAEYWARHMLECVPFDRLARHTVANAITLELGVRSELSPWLHAAADRQDAVVDWDPESTEPASALAGAIARAVARGATAGQPSPFSRTGPSTQNALAEPIVVTGRSWLWTPVTETDGSHRPLRKLVIESTNVVEVVRRLEDDASSHNDLPAVIVTGDDPMARAPAAGAARAWVMTAALERNVDATLILETGRHECHQDFEVVSRCAQPGAWFARTPSGLYQRTLTDASVDPIPRGDGRTVWIAGAGSALTIPVLAWCVSRGAERVLLISRSPLPAEQVARLNAVVEHDTALEFVVADANNLASWGRDQPSPQRVFLLAASSSPGGIGTVDEVALQRAVDAKLAYAKALREFLPADCRLLLFASAAGELGAPDALIYGISNAALSAWADRVGANVTALEFGPWFGLGMSNDMPGSWYGQTEWLDVETGWRALDVALASSAGVIQLFERPNRSPYPRTPLPSLATIGELASRADARDPEPQGRSIDVWLMERLASLIPDAVMDADVSLVDLGLDSLGALDLSRSIWHEFGVRTAVLGPGSTLSVSGLASLIRQRRATATDSSSHRFAHRPATTKKPPLFILCTPRSGSTLLRMMLAGHPDLFAPPELHLFGFDSMDERAEKLKPKGLLGGARLAVDEALGTIERGTAWWDQHAHNSAEELHVALTRLVAPRQLVDKSPTYVASGETLRRIEDQYDGQAMFLHLSRHPAQVVSSFSRGDFAARFDVTDRDPIALWAERERTILEFLETVSPERRRRLRFQDLVRDPSRTMRRLTDWLCLPYDAALLRPYEGQRMAWDRRMDRPAVGDPGVLNHTTIDPSRATTPESSRALDASEAATASALGHVTFPSLIPATEVASLGLRWGAAGAQTPAVLCVHGLFDDAAAFAPLAAALRNRRAVDIIALDLPGHGGASRSRAYDLPLFISAVRDALASLAGRPIHLVGHSYGAVLASIAAGSTEGLDLRTLLLLDPVEPGPASARSLASALTSTSVVQDTNAARMAFPGVPETTLRWIAHRSHVATRGAGPDPGLRHANLSMSGWCIDGPVPLADTVCWWESAERLGHDPAAPETWNWLGQPTRVIVGEQHHLHLTRVSEIAEHLAGRLSP